MAKVYTRKGSPNKYGRFTYKGQDFRKSLDTTSERIAKERLLAWIADVKSGKWVDGRARRKFEDAVLKFIDEHFPRIKPKSRMRYRVSLTNIVNFFEASEHKIAYLEDISSAVLSDFEVARRKDGVTDPTIRRDLMCLASLFSCAEEWEWVEDGHNPPRKFLKKAAKRGLVESEPRNRVFSHEEEKKLISYILQKQTTAKGRRDAHAYKMLETVVTFGIDAGLRAEELLSLTWDKINLKTNEVTVHWTVAKSSKTRIVPILPRSQALLAKLPRCLNSHFVFWRRDGGRYSHMYQQLIRVCRRLGIEDIEFHDLRRTCGARLLRDHRLSKEQVQLWLGHGSIQVTENVYAFLEVDDLHKGVSESPVFRKGAQI